MNMMWRSMRGEWIVWSREVEEVGKASDRHLVYMRT